jgi:hypothetical protein
MMGAMAPLSYLVSSKLTDKEPSKQMHYLKIQKQTDGKIESSLTDQ